LDLNNPNLATALVAILMLAIRLIANAAKPA